ncbi:MAG: MFS transporter [Promicromonosporaceae bacterium]|nr:MFS transporter [Promicromonosporaceae bacterium]
MTTEAITTAAGVPESINPYRELKGARQVLFALGHLGPGALAQFITVWLLLYLSGGEPIILSASLVGTALLTSTIIDAVADPIVANWSDRYHHSKYGRRLPFIIGGTLPMIIAFVMVWLTGYISPSVVWRFIWVAFWLKIFYFTYTIVVNPYFALLPEIAPTKKQRSFIQSFVALFGILGMGFALGASGFLIAHFGHIVSAIIMGVFCALVMIGPMLTIRINPQADVEQLEPGSRNIFISIKDAFGNLAFRNYIIGFCIFFLGFQLIQYNLAFFTTVLLELDTGMSSLLFISSVVSGVALIPVYNIFLRKMTNINALKMAVFSFAIIAVLIALTPVLHTFINGTVLGFALMILLGFPYSGLMVIPNILISEIIDEDKAIHHKAREALFFGVQGLINKFMVALAAFAVGVILDMFGNTIEQPYGVRLIAPLAAVTAIVGYLVLRRSNLGLATAGPVSVEQQEE